MNAALQADFHGAPLPGLAASPHDFVEIEIVGTGPQLVAQLAFGEGAKFASKGANIGVIDVAGNNVADCVANGVPPHRVRGSAQLVKTFSARGKQLRDFSFAEFLAA